MGLNVRVPWPSGTRRRVIGDQLGVGTVNTPTVTINIPKAPSPDTSLCPRKSQQLWGTVRGKEVSVRRQDFSLTPAVVGNTGREEACDGFQLESQETCSRGSRPQCFRWPCTLGRTWHSSPSVLQTQSPRPCRQAPQSLPEMTHCLRSPILGPEVPRREQQGWRWSEGGQGGGLAPGHRLWEALWSRGAF